MKGTTTAAKQQVAQCIKNKDSLSELIVSLEQTTLASKANKIALEGLATAGNALIALAISKAVEAFDNYIHRVERAKEKTEESIITYQNIASEVSNLESKLTDINEQINGLNPITNADDIKNLKAESEELERQLAILEEKEHISKEEADKAAQKSLSMTQASKYQTEKQLNFAYDAYGVKVERPSGTTPGTISIASKVTEAEELQNAMDAYDKYASEKRGLKISYLRRLILLIIHRKSCIHYKHQFLTLILK